MNYIKFQYKYNLKIRQKILNLRPVFYVIIRGNGFTIPDFMIELFNTIKFTHMSAHHGFMLIFEIFNKQKIVEIGN